MAFTPLVSCCTGFEQQSLAIVTSAYYTSASVNTTIYHTGAASMKITGTSYFYFPGVSQADVYVSMWLYATTLTTNYHLVNFTLDTGEEISLKFDTLGYIDAYVDGSKVADGTIAVSTSTWFHLQCHLVISDTGSIDTRVDGTDDIAYTGDTKPGTSATVSYLGSHLHTAGTLYLDDVSIGTAGWPGDIRYDVQTPNADTATEDWTPSTGVDSYAMIDEIPPDDDTTYIGSATTDQQTIIGLSAWDGTGKAPQFCTIWCDGRKTEAAAHQIKLIDSDGAVTNIGAAQDVLTSYAYIAKLLTTAPDGTGWSVGNVNTLQAGVKSVVV